jgi:Fe-S cluster assembly protein SufD
MAQAGVSWQALRAQAQARAAALGAPTSRLEAWRYVDVRALDAGLGAPLATAQALARLKDLPGTGPLPPALIIDGVPCNRQPQGGPEAPAVGALQELPEGDQQALLARWLPALAQEDDVAACWSLADGGDGLRIAAGPGAGDRRLELWLVATGGRSGSRLTIEVGPGAGLDLVLRHIDLGAARASVGIEAQVAAGGRLRVDEVQASAHPGGTALLLVDTRLELGSGASAHWVIGQQGGALVRHRLQARLAGAHGELHLAGLAVLDGSRQAHLLTRVAHAHGATTSTQLVKTVCDGRSQASFDGLVAISAGADGADARQYHHNLLLSPSARVDTRPQLDIAADDVQAAHGATVGRPNPDELFYLRSRGLGEAQALALLRRGFAAEMVALLHNPGLRALADGLLLGSMAGR